MPPARPAVSVVVPIYNENESLAPLHAEIARNLSSMGAPWEVVYVDDRSTDGSLDVLLELRERDPHVRIVRFARNFGQTAALSAGFETARGEIVVTIDGDLQNDPADIPAMVRRVREGYDVVVGWRKARRDGFLLRRLPSIAANRLISRLTGVSIHDTGCTLKAFRRELVENLPIYAEQHRFLPVLSRASGARIAEMVVNHRPRRFGTSKYGIGRTVRVLLDLLSIVMIGSFSRRPLQYFGLLATPFALGSLLIFVTGLRKYGDVSFSNNWGQSVLLTFMMLCMAGVYFLLLGLLAELVVKTSDVHLRKTFGPLPGARGSTAGREA